MQRLNGLKRFFVSGKFSRLGIFLFISVSIWIVNELNATYSTYVKVPIRIEKMPTGFLLQDSVYFANAELKSSGFGFLGNNLGIYSIESVTQYAITETGLLYLSPNHFNQIKIDKLPSNVEFLNWANQDSIFLNVIPSLSKRVKILPNINFKLKRNFVLEKIDIQPETVELFGESQVIKNVDHIYTEELNLGEISANSQHTLSFSNFPENELVSFSPQEVSVSVTVEEFTEKAYQVGLKQLFENNDSLRNQLFLPEMVSVKVKAYKNVLQDLSSQELTNWILPRLSLKNQKSYYTISADKLKVEILDVQFEPDSLRIFERIR